MKVRTKFIVGNTFIVTVALIAAIIACLVSFQHELQRQAAVSQEARIKTLWELLHGKGSEFRVAEGKLYVGDYLLNGNFELPDKLKEICGGTATIFMGDERVSTNVVKPDGSRAIGTRLSGPARETVIVEGKPYRGEAEILGTPYFTAYDPIRNVRGETIGVLYVGVKKSEFYAAYHRLEIVISIIVGVILLGGVVTSYLMIRWMFEPFNRMHDLLVEVAQGNGDLTRRLDYCKQDEIGEMSSSFNTFMDKLQAIIGRVAVTTDHLAAAALQVQGSSGQIAEGTDKVAQQSAAVATAGEEMASTSSEIARNCLQAAEEARQATDSAQSGSAIVEQTITTMNKVSEQVMAAAKTVESLGKRSDEIGEIIGAIEDIADQTNLLALNAAIEAARAGEQGRGFAVVADEVRALAERTTKATRRIAEMITMIQQETNAAVVSIKQGVDQVEAGAGEALRSGAALEDILGRIDALTRQFNQIATAAEEQTSTTCEISRSMHEITGIVHGTARGTQDSAAAAAQLNLLAQELHSLVGQFRLA
ncbi:methyl-accepting chemotaxis protein [Geobacter sp. SVR]|uniref:methyl-accepting chemotaxis protein n=1 Tax=Geobacter sp. SVR TaxID=2495594 RepID=UPI00143EF79A|nr:methyl-accepting chemotaxis protein [Geobacter sp. SVR]BCS52228.1 methyl-accepting chemotaxis protein [Geobacter sp. SVR]GCF85111.1 methyl-accepting chemotaxis protein [Geobacter sp. SVR]